MWILRAAVGPESSIIGSTALWAVLSTCAAGVAQRGLGTDSQVLSHVELFQVFFAGTIAHGGSLACIAQAFLAASG